MLFFNLVVFIWHLLGMHVNTDIYSLITTEHEFEKLSITGVLMVVVCCAARSSYGNNNLKEMLLLKGQLLEL